MNKVAMWINRLVTIFGWLVILLFLTSIFKGDPETVYSVMKILLENALTAFVSVWDTVSTYVSKLVG